ncbi:MAG: hypothetical protein K2M80_07630, partial [Muribaculaceae bacterium]|nr:hypothetical protein [Muribaculaceae bacterium]
KFQRDKNVINMGAEAELILSRLAQIEDQTEQTSLQLSLLKNTRDFLRNNDNKYSLLPMESVAASTQELATAYNSLILQRMTLAAGAKENNTTLRNLDQQINASRDNILLTVEKAIESQQTRLAEYKARNREYEGKLQQFPAEQRLYRAIERQQNVKEQLYLFLLQQREETALSLANAQPGAIIVDQAYTRVEAHTFSAKKTAALILFLTLLIPTALVYLLDKMRTKVQTRKEIEALTNLPILAEISKSHAAAKYPLIVKSGNTSSVAEQFRLARANAQFILGKKDEKVIIVTSSQSGEGKTFISINLAAALSGSNHKVILIGSDIRRPKLAEYLGIDSRYGLTEYLASDRLTLSDIIMKAPLKDSSIDIILAGPIPPNPAELLTELVGAVADGSAPNAADPL